MNVPKIVKRGAGIDKRAPKIDSNVPKIDSQPASMNKRSARSIIRVVRKIKDDLEDINRIPDSSQALSSERGRGARTRSSPRAGYGEEDQLDRRRVESPSSPFTLLFSDE